MIFPMHLLRLVLAALFALAVPAVSSAQSVWMLQISGTTASLRGIHAVNSQIAWASGSNGTILRTLDAGQHWTACATPPDGVKLDFRGVWAWSGTDAMVMSSGPGDLSRVYKTTDGCRHWHLFATNPDPTGFWDAMVFQTPRKGFLLGDPVNHRFVFMTTTDGGVTWKRSAAPGLATGPTATGAFAASNTSLLGGPREPVLFGTGGAWIYRQSYQGTVDLTAKPGTPIRMREVWTATQAPFASAGPASGIFSLGYHAGPTKGYGYTLVAVGGDYTKPNDSTGTAAWSTDGGLHWTAAAHPPHGYRSAVAWDSAAHVWIAAGINGSDISYDDGRTWKSLGNDNWNALSLPFIVGPHGRIGRLNMVALRDSSPQKGGSE